MKVHLVRDILDKKLFDEDDQEAGRVDGLVMQLGERSQPRITHIEVGGTVLAARLHPVFVRMAKWIASVWGPKRDEPVRIPWSKVVTVGKNIKLDVEAKDTGAIAWEVWLARNFIDRIPGSRPDKEEKGSGN